MTFSNCAKNWMAILIVFFIFCLNSDYALSDSGIIKCKSPKEDEQRVWKYSNNQGFYEVWVLHSDNFYPFCNVGYSLQLEKGFLCAYDKDRKIGTIATFIDLQAARITDILIWEDTVLTDPRSWKQKSETPCEMIRN